MPGAAFLELANQLGRDTTDRPATRRDHRRPRDAPAPRGRP
jgi:hypothetical protein